MTLHAEDEMCDDNLTIYDVENCILTGKIEGRRRDKSTYEMKYRLRGYSREGDLIETILKKGVTGKLVIITVYLMEETEE